MAMFVRSVEWKKSLEGSHIVYDDVCIAWVELRARLSVEKIRDSSFVEIH